MRITKKQLRRIIKEERQKLIKEQGAMDKEALSPLIAFAQAYAGLGGAIQSQLIDLANAHIESRSEDLIDAMSRGALDISFRRLQRPLAALAREGSDDAMDMMDALEAAAEIFAQGDAEVEADARAAGDR
tara:strand:- start:199 stop:588 length:390 start_codon:yes stop_codon:yes gene_type:complete